MTASENHFGIYGAWMQGGQAVAARKARGPYTGWLDLPGGSPEPGETHEATLRREIFEECGVRLVEVRSWQPFDATLREASDGSRINFRHTGMIALVTVLDAVAQIENVEDVRAVELNDLRETVQTMSPALMRAMSLLRDLENDRAHLPPNTQTRGEHG